MSSGTNLLQEIVFIFTYFFNELLDAKIIVVTGDLRADECDLLDVHKVTAIIYKPFDMHKIKQCMTDIFLDKPSSHNLKN